MNEPIEHGQDVPPEIAAVVTAWNNKRQEIADVDRELADRDKRIAEFSATLQELNTSHRALGVKRTELVRSAARLQRMAEAGCALEGLTLPAAEGIPLPVGELSLQPPAPSTSTGPAALIEDALTSGPMAVLGDPTDTRVDDAGGDEPAQGPFHRGDHRAR